MGVYFQRFMTRAEMGGFGKVAYDAAEAIIGYRAPHQAQVNHWIDKAAEKFWPTVEWLTQSHSIADFQKLKLELLRLAADRKLGPKILLLHPIFPCFEEVCQVKEGGITVEKAWLLFEESENEKPVLDHRRKILTVSAAEELANSTKSDEARVGYVVGKWGLGAHQEHLDLLAQAKKALGAGGKLIVGVESERAIRTRQLSHHGVFNDRERLLRMAALGMVDAVMLTDPETISPEGINLYYELLWNKIGPHIYFVGNADYHWRSVFEERARRMGTILLWAREKNTISTTELLKRLCD